MELREAIEQISDIRLQMAKSEVFRGYRSLTVGSSGAIGIFAALLQPQLLGSSSVDAVQFAFYWTAIASLCLSIIAAELLYRAFKAGPGLAREMTRHAVSQFAPSLFIGGLLTLSMIRFAAEQAWMLPGLWSFVFALGVFASFRLLPKQIFWVGVYYALCGCLSLRIAEGDLTRSPWLMGVTFGGGQLATALVLYWQLERQHG